MQRHQELHLSVGSQKQRRRYPGAQRKASCGGLLGDAPKESGGGTEGLEDPERRMEFCLIGLADALRRFAVKGTELRRYYLSRALRRARSWCGPLAGSNPARLMPSQEGGPLMALRQIPGKSRADKVQGQEVEPWALI